MNDNRRHFTARGPAPFSDEVIRRFLLGRLRDEEQSTFEEHLFADDGLESRVRLAEFDLADDYALARLNAADREAFAQKFLVSAERRQTLNVSTALRDRFAATSTVASRAGAKDSIGERLQDLFGFDQRARRFGFAAVIVVVILGTAWIVWKKPRIAERIGETIFRRHAPVLAQSPRVLQPAAHSTNTSSAPAHSIPASPMPPHEPTASPAIMTVVLSPGAPRDQMPSIDLPEGEHDIVRLQLGLRPNQTGRFRADLLTSDNQSIFSSQALQSIDTDTGKLDFDVPAALLKSGDYQVSLCHSDDTSKKTIASYYFRAQ